MIHQVMLLTFFMMYQGIKIKEIVSLYQVSLQTLSNNDSLQEKIFRYGLWSKYNPLTNIPYVGDVGLFDSNCFFLHSAVDEDTRSLNLLYFDCLDYKSGKIKKIISFIDINFEEHSFILDIEPFEYENIWYFFEILQYSQQLKFELIFMKNKKTIHYSNLEIKLWSFEDPNILLTFGGSMIVSQSKIPQIESGTKFSYFPGYLILQEYDVDDIQFLKNYEQIAEQIFISFPNQVCYNNIVYDIEDVDVKFLKNSGFLSENINDNAFMLSGWLKITEIISNQEEFMYQILSLTSNFNNSFANKNLSPFSLSYRISSIKNQLIISTYSYTFPQVTIDFSDDPFLIKKEIDLLNQISLWHNLYVKLNDDQLIFEINFYEGHQIYNYRQSFQVIQFKRTQFKVQYGNNLQLRSNYLNVQLRNFKFYNCDIQINQQNCHYSCEDCEGPTKNDCLSCKIGSNRVYIPKYKACVCPIYTIDDKNCLSYQDQNLEIVINSNKKKNCGYGQFEYSDSCFPSIITENLSTCLECLQNPKEWAKTHYCDLNLYLNINGDVEKIISDQFPKFYLFDGSDLIFCQNCDQNQSFVIQDYNIDDNEISIFTQTSCFKNIKYCLVCLYNVIGAICQMCYYDYQLIQGVCTQINNISLSYCVAPFYLTLKKQCMLCPIDFCKYCFEYMINNQNIYSLQKDLEYIDQDEEIKIACALCDENYIYDFDVGKCIYQKPKIPNCLRSFVKDNQEVCTLSQINDFMIASEIVDCQIYQANCLQCILSPESQIKCIICDVGYTASIEFGGCHKTYNLEQLGAKIVIEGSYELQDGWIQRIQSFMMKFLAIPNFYYRNQPNSEIQEQIVECIEGYQLIEFGCRQYCDINCQKCEYDNENLLGFICSKCPLNYYYQPIRDQSYGTCSECPNLCQACQFRSEDEIHSYEPNFVINNEVITYTKKCLKQVSDSNIYLDPYRQVARYCFDEFCSSTFLKKLNYDYCYIADAFWDQFVQIDYLNRIGVDTLIFEFHVISDFNCSLAKIRFGSTLKTKIFSLKFIYYRIISQANQILTTQNTIYIISADNVMISNFVQKRLLSDDFVIKNDKNQIDLQLTNFTIIDSIIQNSESCFQAELFGDIQFNNITILNSKLDNSSFFSLKNSQINGIIIINQLYLINSFFINSNLFQLINNKILLEVQNVYIENCEFQNSSIFFIDSNLDQLNVIKFSDVNIKKCKFVLSNYLNCLNFAILSITNINLILNDIQTSNLINSNYNLTIDYLQASDNQLKDSQIIFFFEKNYNTYVYVRIKNLDIQNFQIWKSNFVKIQSSQEQSGIILEMSQIIFKEIIGPSNIEFIQYLIVVKCYLFVLTDVSLLELNNNFIIYIYDSNEIMIKNIRYERQDQMQNVQLNQICKNDVIIRNQLLKIVNFSSFKLENLLVQNQFNVDESILDLSPKQLQISSNNIKIQIMNAIFKGNLLLHQQLENYFSILAIDSERYIEISISNIEFFENIVHSYIEDTYVSYASLIYINSQSSKVELFNISSKQNAFTNSTNSFIYINSMDVQIINYTVNCHNFLSSDLLQKYYDLQLNDDLDQDQLNQLMFDIVNIKNIGGAGKIKASTFTCIQCNFSNILSYKSAIFEIITENQGKVNLIEITANNLISDLDQITNSSGSISIYSQNSRLYFIIQNSIFTNVLNRMSSSIITIQSSNIQNTIILQDILIQNCISLMNQILLAQFSSKIIEKNKFISKNIKISQNEESWKQFFSKIKTLSINELSAISSDQNAIIYLESCSAYIQNLIFEGYYHSPILILMNLRSLELINMKLSQIQLFYSFTLIKIIQNIDLKSQTNIQQLTIDNSKIYNSDNIKIQSQYQSYIRAGCKSAQTQIQISTAFYYLFELFMSLQQQSQNITSLIIINIQSFSQGNIIILHQITLISNNCSFCNDGLVSFKIIQFEKANIKGLFCNNNLVQQYGCLKFTTSNDIQQIIYLENSNFIQNLGNQGIAISSFNVPIHMKQCKIMYNTAKEKGGGLYLELKSSQFSIKSSFIVENKAREGGGIFLNVDGNLNHNNFIQNQLFFNLATIQGNNLVESPTHLALLINSIEMLSKTQNLTKILDLQPYNTFEQENKIKSNYLMIPSNQIISEFSLSIPKYSQTLIQIDKLALIFKNNLNEQMFNLNNSLCVVSNNIVKLDDTELNGYLKENQLIFNINQNNFDLTTLVFQLDPYNKDYKYLDIIFNCKTEQQSNYLKYNIMAKSFKCQLGEFYVDFGCQKCQSIQGFYSVTYNTTKCSIFDKEKFLEITSNTINLKQGYWRPNYLSDQSTLCFKKIYNCKGGWITGDRSCSEGHIGALCEECDIYNKIGLGKYYKSQSNSDCNLCHGIFNSIIPFLLNTLWAILSIILTLKSIERSNDLFLLFKIKERFSDILFKLNQDLQSILIKMFLTYLWIFSAIFTFDTNFSFQLNFINQASNTSYSMANNLDCFLSEIQTVQLIYLKVLVILILILWQFLIIFIGYLFFSIFTKSKFKFSIITNTLLCLYIFNFAGFIKILCSLVSIREISDYQYIQGDLTRLYSSNEHQLWVFYLVFPGLFIFGCAIPFSLFILMFLKRNSLNQSKLRPHICYLFNEYEPTCYYWEQIKLSKKAIIILILTYFETRITMKASLIGVTLLFYQKLAFKNRPYIQSNLNVLDLQTGQICSLAIFLAAIQYENQTNNNNIASILIQIIIIILFIILSYQFIYSIAIIYIKKYKLLMIKYFYLILKVMKMKKKSQKVQDLLTKQQKKHQRLKDNISKLKKYLMLVSKSQIKHRSVILTTIVSIPTHNPRLMSVEITEQYNMITKRINEF